MTHATELLSRCQRRTSEGPTRTLRQYSTLIGKSADQPKPSHFPENASILMHARQCRWSRMPDVTIREMSPVAKWRSYPKEKPFRRELGRDVALIRPP